MLAEYQEHNHHLNFFRKNATNKENDAAEGTSLNPESHVYTTNIVPINIKFESHDVWDNPACGSNRLCRPFRIHFLKDTKELMVNEYNEFNNQVQELKPTIIKQQEGKEIHILCDFLFTMVDLKTAYAVTGKQN